MTDKERLRHELRETLIKRRWQHRHWSRVQDATDRVHEAVDEIIDLIDERRPGLLGPT